MFLLFNKFPQGVEIEGTSTEILPFIINLHPNKKNFAITFITGSSSNTVVKLSMRPFSGAFGFLVSSSSLAPDPQAMFGGQAFP